MTSEIADQEIWIVLLPGLDGTGQLFRPFMELCPPGFRLTVVNYPADRIVPLQELLQTLQQGLPNGRWLLLAESFSGPLAILLAAAQPTGLVGLVLIATAAKWSRLGWARFAPLATIFSVDPPVAMLRRLVLGTSASPALVAATQQAIRSVRPEVLASRLRELATTDVRSQLSKVAVPILYLQARDDRLARLAERRTVESTNPLVECHVVPGPHFLVQTEPAAVWQHLTAFAGSRFAA